MAVGQNQWYHFGVGAPPILVYFSGDWDVHWGYGLLTHGHMPKPSSPVFIAFALGLPDQVLARRATARAHGPYASGDGKGLLTPDFISQPVDHHWQK